MSKKNGNIIQKLYGVFVALVMLVSCSSTPKQKPVDPNFLGDYEPIALEDLMGLSNEMNKVRPLEIKTFFVPRRNTVEFYFRLGVNSIALVLDEKTREEWLDSIEDYLEDYADEEFLAQYKPTKRNAYENGAISISWGLLGPNHTAKSASYWTNYSYLENKPYFYIYIVPASDKDASDMYSPKTSIYFSPSQLESVKDVLNQENLLKYIEELDTKAYEF